MNTLQQALIGAALAVLSANASALDISNTQTFNQLLVSPTPGVHDRLDFQFDLNADWNPAWSVGDISAISFSFTLFDDSASDGLETGIVTAGGDGIVCSAPVCQKLGLGFIINSQPMIVSRIAEGDLLARRRMPRAAR